MRISIVDSEVKKSATLSIRLIPHVKDEIALMAHEEGISVSDLLTKAFFFYVKEHAKTEEKRKQAEEMYKLMERATRRARPVTRATANISHKVALLKHIKEVEKLALPPSVARNLYEDLLNEVRGNAELTFLVKEMIRDAFGTELLMNKGTLVVYEDFVRIDTCGCYPPLHRDVEALIPKLNERGSILLTNFPFRFYRLIADAQREIWKLCGKEQII